MNYQSLKQDAAKVLNVAGKVAIAIAVAAVCIGGGILYGKHTNAKDEKPTMIIQPSIKLKDVSIAINERDEMIIIDRKTGEYITYEDSVGTAIFTMYAGKLYASKNAQ